MSCTLEPTLRALFRPADFHAFHCLHGDDGTGEFAINAQIPSLCETEADQNAARHYFKDAAIGVSGSISFIDQSFHALFGFGIDATEENFGLLAQFDDFLPGDGAREAFPGSATAMTWLRTSTPNSARSCLTMAPMATRAAVSRALARSRM